MRRLTGFDAAFLYMETACNHMHVASMSVFDASTVPGGYSFDKMRDLVQDRLPLLPPFRWRLVEVPFQLTHPLWVEDPDFDLAVLTRDQFEVGVNHQAHQIGERGPRLPS